VDSSHGSPTEKSAGKPLEAGGRRLVCLAATAFMSKNIAVIGQPDNLLNIAKCKKDPMNLYLQISCLVKNTLPMVRWNGH